MIYPANYGFIPQTLSDDGDPCDVLVLSAVPVVSGAVVRCRPVGALIMTDQAGQDEKIPAVPGTSTISFLITRRCRTYSELPDITAQRRSRISSAPCAKTSSPRNGPRSATGSMLPAPSG